jgi:hypothetical protein
MCRAHSRDGFEAWIGFSWSGSERSWNKTETPAFCVVQLDPGKRSPFSKRISSTTPQQPAEYLRQGAQTTERTSEADAHLREQYWSGRCFSQAIQLVPVTLCNSNHRGNQRHLVSTGRVWHCFNVNSFGMLREWSFIRHFIRPGNGQQFAVSSGASPCYTWKYILFFNFSISFKGWICRYLRIRRKCTKTNSNPFLKYLKNCKPI